MIKIENFTKKYTQIPAVDDLCLEVQKGSVFGFLGPNGAGKTTTLRTLIGLLRPTSGTVFINGINVLENPAKVKSIVGYLPDEIFLYEYLTGRQFLNFVADIHKLTGIPGQTRIEHLLNTFGLSDAADELIANYSFGMKKKIALAGTVIHNPLLLILDEPFNGLDPQSSKDFGNLLKEMVNNDTTVIFSSHVLEVVQKTVTHIGIINKGRLMLSSTLKEALQKYDSLENAFFTLTSQVANQ
ncbi:MAG: ABC transporter ATP-binding protein [Candidatus Ozemobacteraceae bacterium]|jgi:ABC-2 type transport system ATP-binding protein|nr:ABC transporter ATP-binding protein [Candidatus Riflebacteria bacterium]